MRDVLNRTAPRRFAVLDPLKVVIDNYPEGQVEEIAAVNNPEDQAAGTRAVPFARELWIEREDFMEEPAPKFFRLAPGREARLRSAYFVTCTDVVKDADGMIVELRCTYDPATRGGDAPDGRRPKATLHWVSAAHAIPAEVRLVRPPVRERGARRERRRRVRRAEPGLETVLERCLAPALAGRVRRSARPSSSSGSATSSRTPISTPEHLVFNRTLTSRTPGPRSRPRAGRGRPRAGRRGPPAQSRYLSQR